MIRKILIADDHELSRDGLTILVHDRLADTAVLEAGDLDAALDLLVANPDVDLIVVDLGMPGMAGGASLRNLRESYPRAKLVVLSASRERADILDAIAGGIHGYIVKALPADGIAAALQHVLAGGVSFPPEVADLPAEAEAEAAVASSMPPPEIDLARLTARQRDVLRELAKGHATKEIARTLGLAESTVKIHLAALYRHLGARNRTQAAILAAQLKV